MLPMQQREALPSVLAMGGQLYATREMKKIAQIHNRLHY
jgi:hypothetical protein